MKLLTQANLKALPAERTTEGKPEDQQIAVVKLFTPDADWTWFLLETWEEGGERMFYVYEAAMGGCGYTYTNLSTLERLRGPLGLRVERDRYFDPTPMTDVKKELQGKGYPAYFLPTD